MSFRPQCRSSGIGWVLGAGRTGGIASSLGGGLLLTLTGAGGFFGCIAAVLMLTFVAVLSVRRQIVARGYCFASSSGAWSGNTRNFLARIPELQVAPFAHLVHRIPRVDEALEDSLHPRR